MGLPGLGGGGSGGGGGIGDLLSKPLEKLQKLVQSAPDPMKLLSSIGGGAMGGDDSSGQ